MNILSLIGGVVLIAIAAAIAVHAVWIGRVDRQLTKRPGVDRPYGIDQAPRR